MKLSKLNLRHIIKEEVQKFINEQGYGVRQRHMPKQHVKSAAMHDTPQQRRMRQELDWALKHAKEMAKTWGANDELALAAQQKVDSLKRRLGDTVDPEGRGVYQEELTTEPFSDEEQAQHSEAYYELWDFLATSSLPGDKPSEKLESALRWIAKFEEEKQTSKSSTSSEPPHFASHGGFLGATSTGPWEE
jgi:hypothetical protein